MIASLAPCDAPGSGVSCSQDSPASRACARPRVGWPPGSCAGNTPLASGSALPYSPCSASAGRGAKGMTYVIVEACIGVKDRACVDVCPVDCIYEGEDQLYIHPDECIDCGACEPECPVTAIFPEEDVPPQWKSFIAKNKDVFQSANPPGKPSPERGMK